MPTANIGDVNLYYEETGQGEPVLRVPLSWWPAATWNVGVVPALSQRFRTIIVDCYNANPASMADALEAFYAIAPAAKQRLFVIGGMEELGHEARPHWRHASCAAWADASSAVGATTPSASLAIRSVAVNAVVK